MIPTFTLRRTTINFNKYKSYLETSENKRYLGASHIPAQLKVFSRACITGTYLFFSYFVKGSMGHPAKSAYPYFEVTIVLLIS